MGVLDRIASLVKSNVNDLVDKMEDPEKLLDQAILDLGAEQKRAKRQALEATAEQKLVEAKLVKVRAEGERWEREAAAAVQRNDDGAARAALLQKQQALAQVAELEAGLAQLAAQGEQLKQLLTEFDAKVAEAKQRRLELAARAVRAKAALRGKEASELGRPSRDAVNETAAFDTFDRMTEKIERDEALVAATHELGASDAAQQQAQQQAQLQLDKLDVDQQLAALKAKVQTNPTAATPPPAAPASGDAAMDDQLAELKRKLLG